MISTENVCKTYQGKQALSATSLAFIPEKTTVLIGPSGCGKSTLLRILVGLVQPDKGRVLLDGQEMTPKNKEELRHRIGYVIQEGGLFPHLTAERNVTLLADYLGILKAQREARVQELADLVQLPHGLLKQYPANLSGGQRQRVGLMRALMLDPHILLLDEPMGALDPMTRYDLQEQLKAIFDRLGKTVILVTHDMSEAAYFATAEVILMRGGEIVQRGSLEDLRERPSDPYVSQFMRAQRSPLDAGLAEKAPSS